MLDNAHLCLTTQLLCQYIILLRKKKREYYNKLNINSITDSKLFYKTMLIIF